MKRFRFVHRPRKNHHQGLRVPGDAFQISTLEAHDAMVKFGSMPQYLGCQKHNKNHVTCYHTYPVYSMSTWAFLFGRISSIKWGMVWQIISIYFLIFRLRSTLQIITCCFLSSKFLGFIFRYLPPGISFFAIKKNWWIFDPPRWSHTRILVWLGYLELFGFLAIINMQEGKTVFWLNSKTPLKSLKGITTGW